MPEQLTQQQISDSLAYLARRETRRQRDRRHGLLNEEAGTSRLLAVLPYTSDFNDIYREAVQRFSRAMPEKNRFRPSLSAAYLKACLAGAFNQRAGYENLRYQEARGKRRLVVDSPTVLEFCHHTLYPGSEFIEFPFGLSALVKIPVPDFYLLKPQLPEGPSRNRAKKSQRAKDRRVSREPKEYVIDEIVECTATEDRTTFWEKIKQRREERDRFKVLRDAGLTFLIPKRSPLWSLKDEAEHIADIRVSLVSLPYTMDRLGRHVNRIYYEYLEPGATLTLEMMQLKARADLEHEARGPIEIPLRPLRRGRLVRHIPRGVQIRETTGQQ